MNGLFNNLKPREVSVLALMICYAVSTFISGAFVYIFLDLHEIAITATLMISVGVIIPLIIYYSMAQSRFAVFVSLLLLSIVNSGVVMFYGGVNSIFTYFFASIVVTSTYLLGARAAIGYLGLMFVAIVLEATMDFKSFGVPSLDLSPMLFVIMRGLGITLGMVSVVVVAVCYAHEQNMLVVQLQKAKKESEEASELKSQFLANMSHEIRTPLNGVLGMAQILKSTKLNESQTRYIGTLMSSGDALLSLINDILDISAIEAGDIEVQNKTIDFDEVLMRACNVVEADVWAKGLELQYDNQTEACTNFVGDHDRISQILTNLLSNAVKFTDEGSVTIKANCTTDGAEFTVSDTGPGISVEEQKVIFERFRQLDGSKSKRHEGAGLGLAIVKALVDGMGGDIGVESTLGDGATFWVRIPSATPMVYSEQEELRKAS